jgi:hypothetical protein
MKTKQKKNFAKRELPRESSNLEGSYPGNHSNDQSDATNLQVCNSLPFLLKKRSYE